MAQVKEAIQIADVPMSVSGSGSMFRLHPRTTTPKSYRKAYQGKKEKAVMVKILDHLFYEENIIMVNTGTAMLSTAITGKEVDQLSQGMLNAFKLTRDELINVQDDPRG